MESFLAALGREIEDVDEETFDVFSQSLPSQDLGMVDPKTRALEVSIAGREFEIVQSPGVLQSSRDGGTTGAAVWQVSLRFAEWIEWSQNPLFAHGVLSSASTVIELGSGVSSIVPSVLSSKVRKVGATDQTYILKALRENLAVNAQRTKVWKKSHWQEGQGNVNVFALDWENDDITSAMRVNNLSDGVDMIVACDCVYNYALITPFVETCADISLMRKKTDGMEATNTICVIAQQLRQSDVFQQWLETFHERFRVWRVPSESLSEGLREGSGFIVHVGVLRDQLQS